MIEMNYTKNQLDELVKNGSMLRPNSVIKAFDISRPTLISLEVKGILHPIRVTLDSSDREWRYYSVKEVNREAPKYKLKRRITTEKMIKKFIPTSEEHRIIAIWNAHVLLRKFKKNGKVRKTEIIELRKTIRRIGRKKSFEYVIEQLESYLSLCNKGGHIQKGKDYSYTYLLSFVKKIYKDICANREHWWIRLLVNKDKHPKLTKFIADRYSLVFFGKEKSDVKYPSKEYSAFMIIGDRIIYILHRTKKEFTIPNLIDIVMRCAKRMENVDFFIYPGTIAGDTFWNVRLPQYFYSELKVRLPSWKDY